MDSIIQAMYEEQRTEFRKNRAYREEWNRYKKAREKLQGRLAKEDLALLLRLLDSANALREMELILSFPG